MTCSECKTLPQLTMSVVVNGKYYASICSPCVFKLTDGSSLSSGAAGFNRRRDYEDMAQDTIQPYDAAGQPNSEFFRLYPEAAAKTFTASEIEQVKRKI